LQLLVMLACVIITPLRLLAAYTGFRITDAKLDQVRKDLMNEARTLPAEVDHEISVEIERLQALAAAPSLRRGDFAALRRQAEAIAALRQSGNIVLIDRNLRQLVNASAPPAKTAVPELAERALATGKPQVTGLFMEPEGRQLRFAIIVSAKIDGESRYALVRLTDQSALAGLIASYALPRSWQTMISDAAHNIIASSQQEDALAEQVLAPKQGRRAEPAGIFEFTDPEGRSSQRAYTSSALTGWETAVWAPKAQLDAPVQATWRTIGSALWQGRVIAHSVSHTGRAAIALGAGGPMSSAENPRSPRSIP
jgi:hypothetical protein